ncbi:thiolase family protein [Streptomyces clavifer]|uniref:thiolase family protein n=1 Tax=Streptomyces clavifer TaxID=68188 RepID=UPI0037F458B6
MPVVIGLIDEPGRATRAGIPRARTASRSGTAPPEGGQVMGIAADAYAVRSQQRAARARAGGYLERPAVPFKGRNRGAVLAEGGHLRSRTTVQTLGELRPCFTVAPPP